MKDYDKKRSNDFNTDRPTKRKREGLVKSLSNLHLNDKNDNNNENEDVEMKKLNSYDKDKYTTVVLDIDDFNDNDNDNEHQFKMPQIKIPKLVNHTNKLMADTFYNNDNSNNQLILYKPLYKQVEESMKSINTQNHNDNQDTPMEF